MTNKELIDLGGSLAKVKNLNGVKFSYAVAKNINLINSEIENFKESINPSEKFNEFETKRVELAKKYAKKDEKGNPIIEENHYVPENQKALDKDFEKLKKEYKEVIEAREKQAVEFDNLLKEETKIQLFKIKLSDVPEAITTEQMTSIISIIEE